MNKSKFPTKILLNIVRPFFWIVYDLQKEKVFERSLVMRWYNKFGVHLLITLTCYLSMSRLASPEPTFKAGLFPRLGSKFRYSGRTHFETKKVPIERQAPKFERSLSGRRLTSRSMDGKLL